MPNATADLSILTLVANASLVVKLVLAVLLSLSVASWTVIFRKYFFVKRSTQQVDEFEDRFWHGVELMQLLDSARRNKDASGIEERIFEAGMNEFLKQNRQDPHALNSVSRAMKAVYTREMDRMEAGLPLLASIGSTAPYIGLFGTVWGIMNAFTGLATLDNVSLAVVAPGIAEALVATAIGLFAAIPAVVAYNFYNNRIMRLANRIDGFSEEFLNILQRQQSRG
ncbi:MAG: protein TolQ [Sutterella sp.]|nr:protein TolQ [Sutterella sp.]